MKRRNLLAGGATLSTASCVARMASAQTVSGDTAHAGSLEVVAEFFGAGPSGIAVTPDGRIFVGFPRHAVDHDQPSLTELVGGRLVPFPNAEVNVRSGPPPDRRLVPIHGMTTDSRGRIWAIDDGKVASPPIEPGAAKVAGFDPMSNTMIANIVLKPPVLLEDSHMNDLRVDLSHGAAGTAYVADSSFGTRPALVIVDIASSRQRRTLANHHSTQPERGFLTVLEGRTLRYDPIGRGARRHPSALSQRPCRSRCP
jgi:sugar lactone lactonase YvrE